jgi:predicted RNA-binding Zn-ribbon protein involved in translation (DUF1610 family)
MYQLYCQICHWKKITDGSDISELTEAKASQIQKEIPKIDKRTNETILSKYKKRKKRFKCPKCGRLVFPKKIDDPQGDLNSLNEKLNQESEAEELNKRISKDKEKRRIKYEKNWTDGSQGSTK